MIRSFALSLFFVTFSLWVPGVASANGRYEATYALGVWLTWAQICWSRRPGSAWQGGAPATRLRLRAGAGRTAHAYGYARRNHGTDGPAVAR